MPRPRRWCCAPAALIAMLLVGATARAASPDPGARFTVHDHAVAGHNWHLELEVAADAPARVRLAVVYDQHCGETVLARRLPIGPDGDVRLERSFTATDRRGRRHPGRWRLHVRFASATHAEAAFELREPGCTATRTLAADASAGAQGGHHHLHPPLAYADPGSASPAARAQAQAMLDRVRASAALRFPTVQAALAAGYRRYGRGPVTVGVFHLWRHALNRDGRVLDARRPESLVFWQPSAPGAAPILVAYMFRMPPGSRPRFAGSIPMYHQHREGGFQMTHVWLTGDLRSAYANCLPAAELQAQLPAFRLEPAPITTHESAPCPAIALEPDAPPLPGAAPSRTDLTSPPADTTSTPADLPEDHT